MHTGNTFIDKVQNYTRKKYGFFQYDMLLILINPKCIDFLEGLIDKLKLLNRNLRNAYKSKNDIL